MEPNSPRPVQLQSLPHRVPRPGSMGRHGTGKPTFPNKNRRQRSYDSRASVQVRIRRSLACAAPFDRSIERPCWRPPVRLYEACASAISSSANAKNMLGPRLTPTVAIITTKFGVNDPQSNQIDSALEHVQFLHDRVRRPAQRLAPDDRHVPGTLCVSIPTDDLSPEREHEQVSSSFCRCTVGIRERPEGRRTRSAKRCVYRSVDIGQVEHREEGMQDLGILVKKSIR